MAEARHHNSSDWGSQLNLNLYEPGNFLSILSEQYLKERNNNEQQIKLTHDLKITGLLINLVLIITNAYKMRQYHM